MLPELLHDKLRVILAGPGGELEFALEELCRAHPEHADELRARALPVTVTNPERDHLEGLLMACLELDGSEREDFVADLCDRNPEHAEELQKRLAMIDGVAPATDAVAGDTEGSRTIGPYRILDELGEGGMGSVYLAEQKEPVRRRVALKVIKLGMDSAQVLARFEAERQALAMMEHSNIAKVFEGGVTERGRPYLAMEYVRGEPLTDYCDRHRLTLRERLELFRQVCAGVQHAHMKGVIHRDLKPSNILVSHLEGHPVPKIIDFGLARATDHRLVAQTIYTEFGQLIGTPEYMAPEQADMTNLDVDTRVDVYALGVILYELLSGELPFSSKELRRRGLAEVQRVIREEEPPKPSTRVSSLGVTTAQVAARRRIDRATWLRVLRGDLDWIAMRSLEKDPTRRYQTAQALADDVGRTLADQPVEARPPSVTYRLRKLVRRHRGRVAAIAALVVALLGWMTTSSVLYVRAASAQEEADHVADFLEELFEHASPTRSLGRDASVGLLLEQGARRIQREFAGKPSVRARLMHRIAVAYHWLGEGDKAEPLLREAAAIREQIGGPDHEDRLWSLMVLGSVLITQDDFAAAETVLAEVRTHTAHSHGERSTLMVECLQSLARLRHRQRRMPEAVELARAALDLQRALGSGVLSVEGRADLIDQLACILQDSKQAKEALALFEEALAMLQRAHPDGDPRAVKVLLGLAESQRALQQIDAAEATLGRAWKMAVRVYGDRHLILGRVLRDRAEILRARGRVKEAERELQRALGIHDSILPEDHPELAWTLNDLGAVQIALRRYPQARETLRRAVGIYQRLHPAGHVFSAIAEFNLGIAHWESGLGDLRAAAEQFRKSIEQYDQIEPAGHPRSRIPRGYLGTTLLKLGDYAAAVPVYASLLRLDRRHGILESDHWNLVYRGNLGRARCRIGEYEVGLRRLEQAIDLRRRHRPHPNQELEWNLALAQNLISATAAAERLDRIDAARKHADAAARRLEQLADKGQPAVLEQALMRLRMGSLDLRVKKYDLAETALRAAREQLVQVDVGRGEDILECTKLLVELYEAKGDAKTAGEFREKLEKGSKPRDGR